VWFLVVVLVMLGQLQLCDSRDHDVTQFRTWFLGPWASSGRYAVMLGWWAKEGQWRWLEGMACLTTNAHWRYFGGR